MTKKIILVILLLNGIICEAQYNGCFMSGDVSGRSTRCGENSKDEENLKDPMEIMKRAGEFLEKQSRIILDPMTWTIATPAPPPPASAPPVINAAAIASDPALLVQPAVTGAKAQPSYIPLYSLALPHGTNSLLTPISKDLPNVPNLQLLPFVGVVSPGNPQSLQNYSISTSQKNFPLHLDNSEQIGRSQHQFQNQPNYMANEKNEMPPPLKMLPPPPLPKFYAKQQNLKLKENNDLTDMNGVKPIRLVLNWPIAAVASEKGSQPTTV
ncbi:unnamed protein product [Litomosoides sigmodontis]|uniref:Uncharacterized protein n=1 Tax=Litomosoides sigmodontis TaxID=42156 RepID=A0A3P6SV36_LITSI|nr:unnamed protein product [Litomosoides sigmodontis]